MAEHSGNVHSLYQKGSNQEVAALLQDLIMGAVMRPEVQDDHTEITKTESR